MKRLKLILILVFLMAIPCRGAINTFTRSIDNKNTYKNSYRWTGRARDYLLEWAKEVEDRLDGSTGNQSFYFTPGTAPTATEGRVYYDSAADKLKFRNASAWITIEAASGNALDDAYDAGAGITVDGTAVTLTTGTGDNNVVLAIVQNETDNNNNAMTITMGTGATGTGLAINSVASGTDISGDNWSINQAGKLTILEIAQTGDVLFNGTTYDVAFDASREGIVAEDNAIIGFGAGTHDDAPDLTISGDGTNVLVEVATQDAADWIFGATNALDILIHNDAADSLITFDSSAEMVEFNGWDLRVQDLDLICFGDTSDWTLQSSAAKKLKATPATGDGSDSFDIGADTAGADFKLFGADTTGAYCLWDSSNDALWFDKADIALGETDYILFGDTMGTGDISLGCSANNVFTIGQVVADAGEIRFGVADDGLNVSFFGDASGGKMVWTEAGLTSGSLYFTDAHLSLDDESLIYFGSALGTGDFTMGDVSDVLLITQVADGTGSVAFSADGEGMDVKFFGDTASSYMLWDEDYGTNGALEFDVTNLHLGDGDELQFGDKANDGDFTISDESDVWTFAQGTADTGTVAWGADGAGMDCTWFGESASAYMKWDATSADQLLLTGVDNSGTLFVVTAVDASGDSDTITIAHGGSGDGIQLTGGNTDSVAIRAIACAAQTTSIVHLDASTNDWDGATNIGMLQLVADDPFIHANASMIMAVNTGTPIANAGGFMLRLADSGSNQASTAYAFEIETTNNEAMHIDSGTVLIDETLTCVLGCQSNAVAVTANTAAQAGSLIASGVRVVVVSGITADADDFVVLPAGALGDRITIIAEAGSAFEIRTVAASNDTINEQDCDGTKEYAVTDGDIVDLICTEAGVSWVGISHTILGAAKTIVPD